MPKPKHIGTKIKALRKKTKVLKSMTQGDLSKLSGVSVSLISRIEKHGVGSEENVERVMEALNRQKGGKDGNKI